MSEEWPDDDARFTGPKARLDVGGVASGEFTKRIPLDPPALRIMVDTGASARRITAYVRELLADPEARVNISYLSHGGWHGAVETTRGATIKVGCLNGYAEPEIDTLAELFERLVAAVEHSEEINGRRGTEGSA
jgi:hypothetical protein